MKKRIWLWNHYATGMAISRTGRHYWFARFLKEMGYEPVIFCANTFHGSHDSVVVQDGRYHEELVSDIPFVFVKTTEYKGNGIDRLMNVGLFFRNLFPVAKEYARKKGRPDAILASSVHPLTMVAGIQVARKLSVPCICEVRDLWPESLVAYKGMSRGNPLTQALYHCEKWIYANADLLIFTMEGGKDYIIGHKWDKDNGGPVDLDKVYHINNGLDLEEFDINREVNVFSDHDLDDPELFKFVYAGSIRPANNLGLILSAAKHLPQTLKNKIKILIFGDGLEREALEERCSIEGISSVVFKGHVSKKYIPSILEKANATVLNYTNHDIWKYGGSQYKLFEYLAAGRPVLSTIQMGYDVISRYRAGISAENQKPETIAQAMMTLASLEPNEYQQMCQNARRAAMEYDVRVLARRLIDCLQVVLS